MPDNQNTQNNDPNPREGREQDSDSKRRTQRRPGDDEPDNLPRDREEFGEENHAGQSEQPGLPDSKPKEWSPGSGTSS